MVFLRSISLTTITSRTTTSYVLVSTTATNKRTHSLMKTLRTMISSL